MVFEDAVVLNGVELTVVITHRIGNYSGFVSQFTVVAQYVRYEVCADTVGLTFIVVVVGNDTVSSHTCLEVLGEDRFFFTGQIILSEHFAVRSNYIVLTAVDNNLSVVDSFLKICCSHVGMTFPEVVGIFNVGAYHIFVDSTETEHIAGCNGSNRVTVEDSVVTIAGTNVINGIVEVLDYRVEDHKTALTRFAEFVHNVGRFAVPRAVTETEYQVGITYRTEETCYTHPVFVLLAVSAPSTSRYFFKTFDKHVGATDPGVVVIPLQVAVVLTVTTGSGVRCSGSE